MCYGINIETDSGTREYRLQSRVLYGQSSSRNLPTHGSPSQGGGGAGEGTR